MLGNKLRPQIETAKVVNEFEEEMLKMPISQVRDLERKIGKDNGLYSRRVTSAEIKEELKFFEDEGVKQQIMEMPLEEAREMIDKSKNDADVEAEEEHREIEMKNTESKIEKIEADLAKNS